VGNVVAPLEVTPASLEFGPVPVGLGVVRELSLLNPSKLQLTVDARAVEGDAAAFRVVDFSIALAAGGEGRLRVEFRPEVAGPRSATLVLRSNADGAEELRVPLSGAGTPRSVCGDCNAPPANYCASPSALIVYSPNGTCVEDACRYDAAVVSCAGGCDAEKAACSGAPPAPDAGVVPDAGTADAGIPDAGAPPDAGQPGTPDAGVPDAGSGLACIPANYNICTSAPADCQAALAQRQGQCGCSEWTVLVDCQVGGSPSNANCWGAQARCAPAAQVPRTSWDTPGEYAFVVPSGVTEVRARLWGGGGAGGNQAGATGGGGAFVEATFPVTAGETLDVWVAEGGGAFGDGAGASWLRRGTATLAVAAGGGGGGSDGCSGCKTGGRGGAGGAAVGEAGQNLVTPLAPFCTSATGGAGGSQAAGGAGGTNTGSAQYRCNGNPGAAEAGGKATSSGIFSCDVGVGADRWRAGGGQGNGGGGGGGAGWFGGGGAGFIWTYCSGGGGGGSSFVDGLATGVTLTGGQQQAPGNEADSLGAGRGGEAPASPTGGFSSPQPAFDGAPGRVEVFY
jgi:hypothetical protein